MARPRLPIRPDQVDSLARRGWSVAEMAEFFACDRGTLYKRFAAELGRVRAESAHERRKVARCEVARCEAARCEAEEADRSRRIFEIVRQMRGIP